MLVALLQPEWRDERSNEQFFEAFQTWELDIQTYEQHSGKRIQDESKIAVVLGRSPKALKTALATGDHRNVEKCEH